MTTTHDAGLAGADDEDHVAFALTEERVIVTNDVDFLRIASEGTAHAGICYSAVGKHSVGELLQLLLLVHGVYTSEEMNSRVEFL